ncbi:MAG: hypothetical protein E6J47_06100 [Chloroflexi bacterium]|nr:MAG: hypothetical protein E6J47_06100 [Chloroflexota bacterium]
MRLAAGSPAAGLGPHVTAVQVVSQVRESGIDDQDHVAAAPSVAAVGATPRHVSLAAERGGTIAPRAGGHEDPDVVSEHRPPMIATGSRLTGVPR